METNLVLVNNLVPPIATHLSSLSPPSRSKIHCSRLGFQPRNSCSGRPTASCPPNAWLLSLPSLQTKILSYVQDIIFLYKIVSGLVDCPDLLDKIVFHVVKSLVFLLLFGSNDCKLWFLVVTWTRIVSLYHYVSK